MILQEVEKRKEAIMQLEKQIFDIQIKYEGGDFTTKTHANDCVTEADTQIERLLRTIIDDNFPEDSVIGEEEANKVGSSDYSWHIDPIDGTHPFTRGIKEYGSSIGLTYQKKIVMGIIFFSEDRKVYWAIAGQGAYCDTTKLQVSTSPLETTVLATQISIKPEKMQKQRQFLDIVQRKIGHTYIRYAAIWFFLALAKGQINGAYLLGFGGSWDSCAGICIAKEAGAKVSPDLEALKNQGFLWIAEPTLYDLLLEDIQ